MRGKVFIIVFLIILAGLFLRLWNFSNLFYFAIDEEKAAYITTGISSLSHFPTVGHPTSIGIRLGPIFYYLTAPFYKILPSPLIIGYLSVGISIFTMFLIFSAVKKINTLTAVFSVFLYSFSYLNVIYERRGWQLSFESLLIIILFYSLLQLKNAKQIYLFPLTIAITIMTQLEIGLFTYILLIIVFFIIYRIKLNKKYLMLCIFLIFIANSGLLIFDLRHNFLNTKYFLNYFQSNAQIRIKQNEPLTGQRSVYLAHNLIPVALARTIYPAGISNVAIQYANCPTYLNFKQQYIPWYFKLIVFIITFSPLFIYLQKRDKNSDENVAYLIFTLFFLIHFAAIALYTYRFNGEMAEYYLLPAFVFFFVSLGSILEKLYRSKLKILVIAFLLVFAYINIQKIFSSVNPYGYRNKLDAVKFSLSKTGNKPFTLDSFQTCWYSGGYRYLYTLAGKEPLTSYMDQYLSEYYSKDKSTKPQYLVTILTPELIGENPPGYNEYRNKIKLNADFQNSFGAIEVYIRKL